MSNDSNQPNLKDLPILDKLLTAFRVGSMHKEGLFFKNTVCGGIWRDLTRYKNEESSESWHETVEEMQRISDWQIKTLVDALSDASRELHSIFHPGLFVDCGDRICLQAKEAMHEVGA